MRKRIISMLLTAAMVLTLMPAAFAAEGETENVTGRDITSTGLALNSDNMPTEETVYVAGSGTITFIPAKGDNKAKLVLNNATIKKSETDPAIEFSDDVDIELEGTNNLSVINGIASDGTIHIGGNGELTVEAYFSAITAEEDVVVSSGTLVLSGQDGTYAKQNITVEGGNITVTPSEYGLYTNEGNITINNGTLNISSDTEGAKGLFTYDWNEDEGTANIYIHGGTVKVTVDDVAISGYDDIVIDGNANVTAVTSLHGIYTYGGNIIIGGDAKVNALSDGKAIYAYEGNITIDGSANVTAKSDDDAAIDAEGTFAISGNAVVTADGADGEVDIDAKEGCTVADFAKLNALVKTPKGYIAYGICDNNDITKMDIGKDSTLEIKSGAEFTINAGTSVKIADLSALTLDGKLINNGGLEIDITDADAVPKGKIINNGALLLAFADDDTVDVGAVIRAMELTGTDLIYVQTGSGNNTKQDIYTIDGTKLNSVDSIDLSDENLNGDLDKDSYHWDKNTKTLTLKGALVTGIVDSLTDDVTIQTEGNVVIAQMQNSAGGTITVTGKSVTIMFLHNNGDIIFKDTTANVYGIWAYEKEQAPQALDAEDSYSYGVTLINSKVTVGSMEDSKIYTKKLTMDDTSVLTLNAAELECYTENGLEGIQAYLPKDGGYKIGQAPDKDDDFYTILDANGNIVHDIILKKAETTKPSGGSGGGGSSTQYYNITVKSAENGTAEADKKTAAKDTVVTLTVKAAEGYQLDKLTVADSKNAAIALTDKGNGKYEFKMPAGAVTVTAAFAKTQTEPTTTFTDVPENAWYQTAVDYVSSKGLMNGIGNHQFGPTQLTNRGMLVTTLWRMEGSPSSKQAAGFTDVKETDYFYTAVQWAAENKIVNGTSATTFAPNDSITREQLATILYRYAAYKGYDVEQGGMAIREFDDYEKISEFAKTGTAWAVNTGIISGKGNQTLDPQGVATRAEIAAMLMRFCENIAK
jgi:hypothetical protein